MNNPLISICIPTYNGASYLLKKTLQNALLIAESSRGKIEVIVSDNASTDSTDTLLRSFDKNPYYYHKKNDINLGFNGNLKLLIEQYAKGEYCWIIGDDDILDPDAGKLICDVLTNYNPDFVSVRHRVLHPFEFENLVHEDCRSVEVYSFSYFNCIDFNASDSNVLNTFMSTHIFKLVNVKAFDFSSIGDNTWSEFKTTFPNSYIMTETFRESQNCCCITTPIITAIAHTKSWDDKMKVIATRILPSYYSYCNAIKNEGDYLSKNWSIIKRMILFYSLNDIKHFRYSNIPWRNILKAIFKRY